MKRQLLTILALMLVVATVFALVACGGGDTNMHKIQDAANDGIITEDDEYSYASKATAPQDSQNNWLNEDYETVEAELWNVNRNYVVFSAETIKIVQGSSRMNMDINIAWNASEDVLEISLGEVWYYDWNANTNQWVLVFNTAEDEMVKIAMSNYYENGTLNYSDATYDFTDFTKGQLANKYPDADDAEDMIAYDMIKLTQKALDGLHKVYNAKGYPIKAN